MAKVFNNKAQATLFEVEQATQKKQVVAKRKKGVTLYHIPMEKLGLIACENFAEYIRSGRSNKTIL